ncbi:unnamed protein product [Bursaphelenchus okinawaensis]|uniref:Saposin A-type domain-containing protein n=1 Tax=Bursaphelenchus okinawaensis TaxID=465554 RepID=A0A811LE48_9BILA|nr:unnamed protein product [Bursaphelenchus okinawaensis]CAG9121363.1 unnamed protein product [Bursaphelenchus okinawaensis]
MLYQLLALCLLFHVTVALEVDCDRIPPPMWCDNETIADHCGVGDLCRGFLAKNSGKKVTLTLFYKHNCYDCYEEITGDLYRNYSNLGMFEVDFKPLGEKMDVYNPNYEAAKYVSSASRVIVDSYRWTKCYMEVFDSSNQNVTICADTCNQRFDIPKNIVDEIKLLNKYLGDRFVADNFKADENAFPETSDYVPYALYNGIGLVSIQEFSFSYNLLWSYYPNKNQRLNGRSSMLTAQTF